MDFCMSSACAEHGIIQQRVQLINNNIWDVKEGKFRKNFPKTFILGPR